jgi:hypothetical protein
MIDKTKIKELLITYNGIFNKIIEDYYYLKNNGFTNDKIISFWCRPQMGELLKFEDDAKAMMELIGE